jgi:hypothetical protein
MNAAPVDLAAAFAKHRLSVPKELYSTYTYDVGPYRWSE